MFAKINSFPVLGQQHPVLPLVMLLAGIAPVMSNAYPFAVQLPGFLVVGCGGLLVWLAYSKDIPQPACKGPLAVGFLFLSWQVMALGWSVDFNSTVNEIMRFACYLAVFWQVRTSFGRREVDKLTSFLLFIGSLVGLVGLLEYVFLHAGRIQSTFINPNPLGIYLAMLLLLGLGRYWQRGGLLPASAVVITGTALILSGSRGSLLAGSAGLLICLVLAGREGLAGRLRQTAGLCLAVASLSKVLALLAPIVQKYSSGSLLLTVLVRPDSLLGSSFEGRLAFWQVAGRMFMERPWTGFGPGSFHDAYFSYYDGGRFYSLYTHNHYLQLLSESGIPGLALFLLLIITILLPLVMLRRQRGLDLPLASICGAMCAFLLHLMMDFSWDMPAVTLLFFVLAACGQLLVAWEKEGPLPGGVITDGSLQPDAAALKVLALEPVAEAPENPATGRLLLAMTKWWRSGRQMALPCLLLSLFLIAGSLLLGAGYVYASRGDRLAAANERETALQSWSMAVRLNPWNDGYRHALGNALATMPAGSAAFTNAGYQLQRALELSPYDYKHASRLAHYLEEAGNREEAGKMYRRAVELGGFVPSLYLDLGNYYMDAGQKQLAGEIWLQGLGQAANALAAAPAAHREKVLQTTRALHFNLARYYDSQSAYQLAAGHLQQILNLYPNDPLARPILESYRKAGYI